MNHLPIPGGLLIVVEGIDGAGKTTLARALAASFEEVGAVVSMSKEPTAGEWGMKLRDSAAHGRLSPADEMKYLILDRRQHVDQVIAPALARGEIVILDRYYPSMIAYQGAAGVPLDELAQANSFAPRPHVVLLLDVEPSVGLQRILARGDRPNAFETADNLQICRELFLAMQIPGKRVIDASRDASVVFVDAQVEALLALQGRFHESLGMTPAAVEAMVPYLPSLQEA